VVIVNPEFIKLIKETNSLKEMLCHKIVERESLIIHECKNMKLEYMLRIGNLEYDLMKKQNELLVLKRIKELEKTKKYSQEEIAKKVEIEFSEFKVMEKKLLNDIDIAIDLSMTNLLGDNEIKRLNDVYYKLQLILNPDLKLTSSEKEDELFECAKKSYKKGNVKKLEKILEGYKDETIVDEYENLSKLRNRYSLLIEENQKIITKIKMSFPYNQKDTLQDNNLLRRKKDEINSKIYAYDEEIKKIKKK
jgi:DNA-binding XRE family transcriptional regulator